MKASSASRAPLLFLLLSACGGAIDRTAPGGRASPAADGPTTTPPADEAPPAFGPQAPCEAPEGATVYACHLAGDVRLLGSLAVAVPGVAAEVFAVQRDEARGEGVLVRLAEGKEPATVYRWKTTESLDALGRHSGFGNRRAGGTSVSFVHGGSSFVEVDLATGVATTLDPDPAVYYRPPYHTGRAPNGELEVRIAYDGKVSRDEAAPVSAPFFLGQTNMHDDQPVDLFVDSPDGRGIVHRREWSPGDLPGVVGEIPPTARDVQAVHDAIFYVDAAAAAGPFTFGFARIDWKQRKLAFSPMFSRDRAPSAVTFSGDRVYWAEGGDLFSSSVYAGQAAVGAPVRVAALTPSSRGATVVTREPEGAEPPLSSRMVFPVRDPRNPGETMLVTVPTP